MTKPVQIPTNVEIADRVLGPLTFRQLAILAASGGMIYLIWLGIRDFVPIPVFMIIAVPLGVMAAMLALGQRDGISLDRLVLAAIRQRLAPRHQVSTPEGVLPVPAWLSSRIASSDAQHGGPAGPLQLPVQDIISTGVVDLGIDGLALIASASSVNFALRTPAEQDALVAVFARYLHSLSVAVQIVIRTDYLDLSLRINNVRQRANSLPHAALERAAHEHAEYLADLEKTNLFSRQILLVFREKHHYEGTKKGGLWSHLPLRKTFSHRDDVDARTEIRHHMETRLIRRLGEAIDLLAPAGIVITPLKAEQAETVLAAACNPDTLIPPSARAALGNDVITTDGDDDDWEETAPRVRAGGGRDDYA